MAHYIVIVGWAFVLREGINFFLGILNKNEGQFCSCPHIAKYGEQLCASCVDLEAKRILHRACRKGDDDVAMP